MTCNFSVEQLAVATTAAYGNAQKFHPHLVAAMARFDISSLERQAAFLATVAVESQHLSDVEEGLYYKDAARLARIYPRAFKNAAAAAPYACNPKGLGDLLYKGYWGRGLIQLTWRRNYERASEALGYDYVGDPTMVAEPKHAALTAAWYWHDAGCNGPADAEDMTEVTRKVNGPALMHLTERKAQYAIAKKALATTGA